MQTVVRPKNVPNQLQHIIRMFGTNLDGTKPLLIALTAIKGIGRRYADMVIKKANVASNKRAGELESDELARINDVISHPANYNIPVWAMNRQRDINEGINTHLVANGLDACFRLFIEKGKKIRNVRVQRLEAGLKVRGQRTKSNGRNGTSMGVTRKK